MKSKKEGLMKKLELGEIEGQFGLMLREKKDHNNYVLLRLGDLEDIVKYFDLFKKVVVQ